LPVSSVFHTSKDTRCALWHITESADELLQHSMLPVSMREESMLYRHEQRKKQWLAARICIASLLKRNDYSLFYDSEGKPRIINSEMHISVTHSGEYAAVMLAESAGSGIDIEKISNRIEKVEDKFLSGKESKFISNDLRPLHLTTCWAVKECIFKYHGCKELDFRTRILIEPFAPENSGYVTAALTLASEEMTFLLRYECFNDYVLAYLF
jgi:4'-phosphopantetheinyl transferase